MNGKESIRQKTFSLLDDNPLLTAKSLCHRLSLPAGKYMNYLSKLKTEWKYYIKNERGSICSIHGWYGYTYVSNILDLKQTRNKAMERGWIGTSARNRWLLWRDRLGRIQWFETGRVNLYVRSPASKGRACQLISNGFSFTRLVEDSKLLERILSGIKFHGAHYVFGTGQGLPKITINNFEQSNGVIVKVGDKSHPSSIEIDCRYPDWAERNERVLEKLIEMMEKMANMPKPELYQNTNRPTGGLSYIG